jgi:hypothetical protein
MISAHCAFGEHGDWRNQRNNSLIIYQNFQFWPQSALYRSAT